MRFLVIGLGALTLAGCGQQAGKAERGGDVAMQDLKAPAGVYADAAPAATDAGSAPAPQETVPAGAPMLAYTYSYGLEAPSRSVRGLMARHEAACAAAGYRVCQVTSSSVAEQGEDHLTATLVLRATPAWVQRFRTGLDGEAKAAGGRVTRADVASEDLSRQIVDTEARLRAMTTLRDRLQTLLATRPGKLSDLVEIERELARVQGDIDSTQSVLAVMRGRVSMSEVTLSYGSRGVLAPSGVWSPLTRAFTDFIGIVAFTLGAMVRLIAWLAPWVLVGGGLIWLFRKRLPRPRWSWGRKTPPAA